MNLTFKKKSFFFKLSSKVDNSNTTYNYKSGWIIKLKNMEKGVGCLLYTSDAADET